MATASRACEACGAVMAPEPPRRGAIRRLCTSCAGPAEYQRRWIANRRPDYRAEHAAARRVHHEPRPCPTCGLLFTPDRATALYCCRLCGYQLRTWGRPYTPEGAADHVRRHHAPNPRRSIQP